MQLRVDVGGHPDAADSLDVAGTRTESDPVEQVHDRPIVVSRRRSMQKRLRYGTEGQREDGRERESLVTRVHEDRSCPH